MSQDPLQLVCIEPHFPGRLGWVADWLVRHRGYRCQFLFHTADPPEHQPAAVGHGLELIHFDIGGVAREPAVNWTRGLERGLCYAYGAWEVLEARRLRAVDLVLGRSAGLGSTLFVPIAIPRIPIVNLFDQYIHPHANDFADEDSSQMPPEYFHWRRAANAMDILDLENHVSAWTTSRWQRDLFPPEYHDDFLVLFDGIRPQASRASTTGHRQIAGRMIEPGTRIVSFVASVPDRLRGFDRFVALANQLLRERSNVLCVVAGGGRVRHMMDVRYYGEDYSAIVLRDNPPFDPSRFWQLGHVSPDIVSHLLAITDLHIVAGRPYSVPRSCLEAMGAGAVVLAWDNEPIREFITRGENGLIAPSDDLDAQRKLALAVLDDPAAHRPLGESAARLVKERYSREVTLPVLATHFNHLVSL